MDQNPGIRSQVRFVPVDRELESIGKVYLRTVSDGILRAMNIGQRVLHITGTFVGIDRLDSGVEQRLEGSKNVVEADLLAASDVDGLPVTLVGGSIQCQPVS